MRDLKGKSPEEPTRWLRLRVSLVGLFFLLCLLALFARAVELQVFERDRLRGLAEDQYVREVEIPSRRGDIFDRRGVPLAQSVEVDSISIDPSLVDDLPSASRKLAAKLSLDPNELYARLERARRFAWVKRQARPDEVAAVRALNLPGLKFVKEPRRFYPQRELAAQLVGVVGTDGRGLDGLELSFDDELSGQAAQLVGLRDAKGRKLLTGTISEQLGRAGASMTLTIDRHLQFLAERALAKAVEDAKATAGSVVMLDPRTGEVLALANSPRFNPNTPQGRTAEAMRNRAVTDAFEPGSTFKAFLVAAALEERRIKRDDIFFCENGAWPIGRHVINDTHPYGWLSVGRVLQVSSNICAAKIGQLLGRDLLVDYYARFGFGERAGLGLPSEARGVVPYPKAEVALATQSFGQGLTASAVQIAAAYGALANGGVLMRPYVVSRVQDPDGLTLLENRPTEVRRVVSAQTAKAVLSMLELVVEKEGTAPKAKLEHYRVAGKTGTAQKVDPVAKGYSDKRIASFVGVLPADAPRLVILIVIDEPKTDVYGGLVAAPAFKEIATAAMPYLGVAPDAAPRPAPAAPARAEPVAESKPAAAEPVAVAERPGEGTVVVPDLRGQTGRAAVGRLLAVALQPRLSGSGKVVEQTPAPGTLVGKGAPVTLQLAGALPP